MDHVAIQVPASLYVELYGVYGERTEQEIVSALQLLAGRVPEVQEKATLRPGVGTKTGRVWEIADELKKEKGSAARLEVVEACIAEGINMNTASTQYSHWKNENL